ncbi:MAG: hypothetical protein AAF224_07745 [Pseudomonadota bacterium]
MAMSNPLKLKIICASAVLGVASVAVAEQIEIPNTFVAGTPARASEVNANFAALASESNAQDTRVSALEAAVPEQQVICLVFINGNPTSGGWPGNPVSEWSCVSSSNPTTTFSESLSDLLADGWRVSTVGGDSNNSAVFVFEK